MPIAGIDQISAWLAATDITELELTGPDAYLRLTQGQGGVVAAFGIVACRVARISARVIFLDDLVQRVNNTQGK